MTTLDDLTAQPHPEIEDGLDRSVGDLWMERVRLHFHDAYAGIPMTKFPEDLRVYEHLLWDASPQVVVEVGLHHGASALWFRDRLQTLERYGRAADTFVIGIDVDVAAARHNLSQADPSSLDRVRLIEGDIREQETIDRIVALVPTGAGCMVVEDSAHQYDTTLASLRGLAPLVASGHFFVVEDGCVDVEAMRMDAQWPRGVLPAVRDWLATEQGQVFERRRDLELYGITCHPGGFLQRRL